MKICSRCKKEKPLSDFNIKNREKGLRQYHCKDCSRLYVQSHYKRNREYYLLKAAKRNDRIQRENMNFIWKYLICHPCVDCGEKDPIVLEFDHISDKITEISKMRRNFRVGIIKKEIEKCEVRCANCHRRKTANERGWKKQIMPL